MRYAYPVQSISPHQRSTCVRVCVLNAGNLFSWLIYSAGETLTTCQVHKDATTLVICNTRIILMLSDMCTLYIEHYEMKHHRRNLCTWRDRGRTLPTSPPYNIPKFIKVYFQVFIKFVWAFHDHGVNYSLLLSVSSALLTLHVPFSCFLCRSVRLHCSFSGLLNSLLVAYYFFVSVLDLQVFCCQALLIHVFCYFFRSDLS